MWGVREGNSASSLIHTVSGHLLQWLLLTWEALQKPPAEPHFSVPHSTSWEGTSLIAALCGSTIRTPYPASSRVKWSQRSLFWTPLPFSTSSSNKILVAKLFYCQGVILLGLILLLAFRRVLLDNKGCVIKQSVNFTARV